MSPIVHASYDLFKCPFHGICECVLRLFPVLLLITPSEVAAAGEPHECSSVANTSGALVGTTCLVQQQYRTRSMRTERCRLLTWMSCTVLLLICVIASSENLKQGSWPDEPNPL